MKPLFFHLGNGRTVCQEQLILAKSRHMDNLVKSQLYVSVKILHAFTKQESQTFLCFALVKISVHRDAFFQAFILASLVGHS